MGFDTIEINLVYAISHVGTVLMMLILNIGNDVEERVFHYDPFDHVSSP